MHVRLAPLERPAKAAAVAIPLAFAVVGIALAVGSAVLAEEPATEGIGTFGVEAGAALWFGGAVALSLRARSARHLIDVIVLGRVQPGLDAVGRLAPTSALDVTLEWAWPPVAVRVLPGDAASPG